MNWQQKKKMQLTTDGSEVILMAMLPGYIMKKYLGEPAAIRLSGGAPTANSICFYAF